MARWTVGRCRSLGSTGLRGPLLQRRAPAPRSGWPRPGARCGGWRRSRPPPPAPRRGRRAEGAAAAAPRTRTEIRLAEIWREVLRVEEVSADANFFELGGHSLLVAQLASRGRGAFGLARPARRA